MGIDSKEKEEKGYQTSNFLTSSQVTVYDNHQSSA